ncbi:alanine racemase [Thalassolituus sp. LLYu03]|uniref:alanine racemase n=1 Tax=Thalassolituus sp. LLYu03 TaxID=3421656 RepID=UPI003D2D1FD5
MTRPTRAVINWSHLRHNYELVKATGTGRTYAVIKANGYGHGLLNCARALSGADGFAVACVDEAMVLREAGIQRKIVVLQGAYDGAEWKLAAEHNIQLVVHHEQQLDERDSITLPATVGVWLKINSGMNRVGFRPEQADAVLARISADDKLDLRHVMTHFAAADEADSGSFAEQVALMSSREWPVSLSLSNSAALFRGTGIEEGVRRPGICLYGSSPMPHKTAAELGLKAVMSLESRVISTHKVPAGEAVGYGADWRAERDTRVGVITVGYGDGYPRHAPAGTPVLVDGVECPLIGRVSMDMITVDLTDHPLAHIGSHVELWGDHLSVDRIAALCGTISYELFCQLTPRVKRVARELPSDTQNTPLAAARV